MNVITDEPVTGVADRVAAVAGLPATTRRTGSSSSR